MSRVTNSLIISLTNSLRDVISNSIGINQSDIRFDSVGELTHLPDQGLSLFLYKISENPFLKNQDSSPETYSNPVKLRNPPLVLDLHYLVTPFGNSDNRLIVLEQILKLFHDFPTITKSMMSEPLIEAGNDEIKIFLTEMSVEQLNSLWNMFPNIQYRPTLTYIVSPLMIPSSRITEPAISRVISKTIYSSKFSAESK